MEEILLVDVGGSCRRCCVTTGMHSIADVWPGRRLSRGGPNAGDMENDPADHPRTHCQFLEGMALWSGSGSSTTAALRLRLDLFGIWMIDTILGPGRQSVRSASFSAPRLERRCGRNGWRVSGAAASMGFYGAVLGATLGTTSALLLHVNLWISACGHQHRCARDQRASGRLRCLVQGCCHGRVAESVPGIRYTGDPHARACAGSRTWQSPRSYATPVYSILWNVVVELALLRLLQLHSSSTLIFGIYLILSSAGRFVEEAYRGEPQTATIFGLHLYQWIAVTLAIAGAVITTVKSSPLPAATLTSV